MLLCLGRRVIWQRYADGKLRRPGQRPDHTSKNLCLSLCNKRNTSLYNWFRKLTPFSQLIRFKSNTNRDLVTCVFPRFRQLAWFYWKFSLAVCDIFLRSDWFLWLLWFSFCDTQSECALVKSLPKSKRVRFPFQVLPPAVIHGQNKILTM